MPNNTQTIAATNVSNLEVLLKKVESFGAKYNPSRNELKSPNLTLLLTAAQASILQFSTASSERKNAVDVRSLAFAELSGIAARCLDALRACESNPVVIETAAAITRMIRGTSSAARKTQTPPPETETPATPASRHSTSQMSFPDRISNFENLITYLTTLPQYNPNENELKIAGLNTYLTELKTKSAAVDTANIVLETARINRNNLLQASETGIYDISNAVKAYIRSIYSRNSPESKTVETIRFQKIK